MQTQTNASFGSAVSHWALDTVSGSISARDQYGNLVMTIAIGPRFGERLAAAFNSRMPVGMNPALT